MGAIVGVTAWSRGQEKLGGIINGGSFSTSTVPMPTTFISRSGKPGPLQSFPEL
jgi:hypothetical protein